ncbi:hypothetical protein [Burkholderia vietnamiensis]|uniref:hypothetical protein n=1 Tax=Burkholderia vietnamiensis TaxID=60552 RepID=UPI001B8EFC26|nr:hypothetical protein [Burkholderia vietnamiensis]MBR8000420.1 hypothetical protein [Burkholderia vietnamiensis]MCA8451558.1 hypothetical protein [Burkholderia vietnamiensis]HDR8954169.1 hypothetical protein [Burkholderia vietnamiensis]
MGLKTWGIKAAKALRTDAGALVGERQHRETIGHIRGAARQIFTPAPRAQWSRLSDPPNRAAFAAKYHAVGLSEADLAARHASFARSAWVCAVAFIFLFTLLACAVVQRGAASIPLVLSGLFAVSIAGALWFRYALWSFQLRHRYLDGVATFLRSPGEWIPPASMPVVSIVDSIGRSMVVVDETGRPGPDHH